MKTNITRDIDREYGYDLEIETSVSRDGIACHGYLNGDCVITEFGPNAESETKKRLYNAVSWELDNGAREQTYAAYCEAEPTDESPYGELPAPTSYAALVEAREAAYIAQRDADQKLSEIKAALTASIAADPAYKNDAQRKAELANRLQDYDIYVDNATKTADAYRRALAATKSTKSRLKTNAPSCGTKRRNLNSAPLNCNCRPRRLSSQ